MVSHNGNFVVECASCLKTCMVRKLAQLCKVEFVMLQETKLEGCNGRVIEILWASDEIITSLPMSRSSNLVVLWN